MTTSPAQDEKDQANKNLTSIVYLLQAVGIFIGITYLVAVIINYVKRDDVRTTWLESHFTWQIRTFWFSLLWAVAGAVGTFFLIGYFVLFADTVWVIYRIVKGWLWLNDGKAMYPDSGIRPNQ